MESTNSNNNSNNSPTNEINVFPISIGTSSPTLHHTRNRRHDTTRTRTTAATYCQSDRSFADLNPHLRICRYYQMGHCMYGDNCRFIHDDNEFDTINESDSNHIYRGEGGNTVIMCRYFQNGYCRNGDNCPFSHENNSNLDAFNNNNNCCATSTAASVSCQPFKSLNNDTDTTSATATTEQNASNSNDNNDDDNEKERLETCTICFENIVQSKKRFGLLSDCNHIFCLDCIMTWRESYKKKQQQQEQGPQQQQSHYQQSAQAPREAGFTDTNNNNTTAYNNNSSTNVNRIRNPSQSPFHPSPLDSDSMPFPPDIAHIHSMLHEIESSFFSSLDQPRLPPQLMAEMLIQSFIFSTIESTTAENSTPNKSTTHSCPICRIESKYVIPSHQYISDSHEKEEYYKQYKASKKYIKCKNFNGTKGSCPFGRDCYYAHYDANGVDVKSNDIKPGERRMSQQNNRNRNGRRGRRGGINGRNMYIGSIPTGRMSVEDDYDYDEDENSFRRMLRAMEVMHYARQFNRFESDDDEMDSINSDDDHDESHDDESTDNMPGLERHHRNPLFESAQGRQRGLESISSSSETHSSMPRLMQRNENVFISSSDDDSDHSGSSDSSMPLLMQRNDVDSSSSDSDNENNNDSSRYIPCLLRRENDSNSSSSSDDEDNLDDSVSLDTSMPSSLQPRNDESSSSELDDADNCAGMPSLIERELPNDFLEHCNFDEKSNESEELEIEGYPWDGAERHIVNEECESDDMYYDADENF